MASTPGNGLTRLAPTPSGLLHAGNAFNFLLTHALARALGLRILLRIDDLDSERVRPVYVDHVFHILHALGIRWDLGPRTPQELATQWSQQYRLPRYHALIDALRAGGHLYACACSRSALRQLGADGRYPGTCRGAGLPMDAPEVAWRLYIPDDAVVPVPGLHGDARQVPLGALMGDPVLRQRNGRPAYQVASLSDDVDHGVTHVVRGEDLLPSTACQLHMAGLLGLTAFQQVRFVHHPLLRDAGGGKLSKSAGSAALGSDPAPVYPVEALRQQAQDLLGDLLKG